MSWQVEYLPEAVEDLKALDASQRNRVVKAIQKVSSNPFPTYGDAKGRCGYGKPLGNKMGFDLAGLLKIKLRQDGIRVVYKLEEDRGAMKVIIVGMRSDDEVYRLAVKRRKERELCAADLDDARSPIQRSPITRPQVKSHVGEHHRAPEPRDLRVHLRRGDFSPTEIRPHVCRREAQVRRRGRGGFHRYLDVTLLV